MRAGWKRVTSIIVLWSYIFQMMVALAAPLTPVSSTAQNGAVGSGYPSSYSNSSGVDMVTGQPVDPMNVPQNFNLTSDNLGLPGPLAVGVNYDTLLGTIVNGQYAQKLTDVAAIAGIGEYGSDQYRLNGTLGYQLYEQGLVKFSAEYLSQVLPFNFDSGNINQRVGQEAYGLRFQHSLHDKIIKNVNMGGYWAQAPNTGLSTLSFIGDDGLMYFNERNLAGATSQGLDVGSDLLLSPTTSVSAKLYYDDVNYNTQFTPDSSYDAQGVGGSLKVNQLLGNRVELSVGGEARKIYNTYGAELGYIPNSPLAMKISLFAQRLISSNPTPDSNNFGVEVRFLSDNGGKINQHYDNFQAATDIAQWVKTPAIYMDRVLVIAEQQTYLAGLTLTSIDPNYGPLVGGNTVTITGTNFSPNAQVTFGTQPAIVTWISPTELSVVVPVGNIDDPLVDVTVTNPDGQTAVIGGYTYDSSTAPTLTGITPAVGPVVGGTPITLTGVNLIGTTGVTLGGDPATDVVVVNSTTVTAVTPGHALGPVDVMLINPDGNTTLPDGFTYQTPTPTLTTISPDSGTTAGGTPVTITGTHLTGTTGLTLGGSPLTDVVAVDDNTVTGITTPHAAGLVDLLLINPDGNVTLPGVYTYVSPAPGLTSLTPTSGSTLGGTPVILIGTNLTGTTAVTFGGAAATDVTVVNDTTVTAVTSPHTAGLVNVVLTSPGGDTTLPNAFTYVLETPVLTSLTPIVGPTDGGTPVTLTGTNLTGTTVVTFGGAAATNVTVIDDTTVTAVTAPHAAGLVNVVLTSPGGDTTLPNAFTYQVPEPVLTSLTPTSGPTVGGTPIILTGTNLTGTTAVTFGGAEATDVTVVNDTTVTATTAPHVAGLVDVVLTNPDGSTTLPNAYTYIVEVPTLLSLTPIVGSTLGGTPVIITGTHLTGTTDVTFGGAAATGITVVNDNTVTVITAAHTAGLVDVSITSSAGTGTLSNAYTYQLPAPVLTSLTPTQGSTLGGTPVIITGTNLTGTTGVTFGGTAATGITVVNDNTVTVITAAHTAGLVDVTITNPDGSGTLTNAYTYILETPILTSLTPVVGPIAGGTSVVITGSHFTGTSGVTFGGSAATGVTVLSDTSVSVITPAHAVGLVDVAITTPEGTGTLTNAFTYQIPAPILISLLPTFGSTAGGTSVTLTGTNLTGTTGVTFGGTPATGVTVNSDTSVTVTTAAHIAGIVDVTLTTPEGSSTLVNGYTYTTPPTTLTSLTPTSGPTAGGTLVTLTGGSLTGTSAVVFGGIAATSVTVVNSTTVTAVTAARVAGLVDVSITSTSGSATLTNAYTYVAPLPTLTSLTPTFGLITGGTSVTLTGTGLTGTTGVTFGGAAATGVTVNSDTSVTVTTAAHVAGLVSVTLTTAGGSATLTNAYTYIAPPSLLSLTPISGTVNGGTLVTFTGTSLTGTTGVTFDGGTATSVTVINATTVTALTPAHAVGLVNVTLTTAGGSSTLTNAYTYVAVPTLVSIAPTSGTTLGGTLVTFTGTHLTGATAATFGGSSATSVTVINDTSVTVLTPLHAAGLVNVTLTTPGGTATLTNAYTYIAPPTLLSMSPSAGSTIGGNTVTFTGTNLTGATTISFAGNLATSVTVINSTTLTATAPAHAAGLVNVTVTTPVGSSTLANAYTYVVPPTLTFLTPPTGTTLGGTTVTLNGTGLTGTTSVTFAGIAGTGIVVNSSTSVTVTTPLHAAGVVSVALTTPGGTATLTNAYTYITPPTLTSLSPTTGSTVGGNAVTLIGSNFTGTTAVTFGGLDATSVTVINSNTVTVVAPAHAAGAVNITLSTGVGSSTLTSAYTYVTPPTLTFLSPPTGTTLGGTTVTINGSSLTGTTSVIFGGGSPATSIVVNSDSSVTVTSPAHASGTVNVSLTTAGGTATLTSAYTYITPPTLTSLSPSAGSTLGGNSVTLVGSNLTNTTAVTFNGINATSITVVNSGTVTVVAPAHAEGVVSVTLSTAVGSATLTNSYTYSTPPTLTFLSPPNGSTIGGTTVTINGSDLLGVSSVAFDGSAASIVSVTDNVITVTTSSHGPATVDVTVTNAAGSATLSSAYTYELPPVLVSLTPTSGSVVGGTLVTLIGTNLTGTTSVSFDGSFATNVTVVNDSTVTVRTPAESAGTVSVTLTNPVASSVLTAAYTYI